MNQPATALEVKADLRCEMDGRSVGISAEGNKILIDLICTDDARTVLQVVRSNTSVRKQAQSLKRMLDLAKLQVEARVNGRVMGRIGFGVGTRFWRLFGLPRMQLNPLAILVEATRNRDISKVEQRTR